MSSVEMKFYEGSRPSRPAKLTLSKWWGHCQAVGSISSNYGDTGIKWLCNRCDETGCNNHTKNTYANWSLAHSIVLMQRLLISQPWFTDCEGSRATGHKDSQSTDEYWVCNSQKLQDQLWGVQSIKSNRWDRSCRNILQAWTVWDDVGCIFMIFHVFSVVALRCFICGQVMPWAGCAMSKQELEAIAEVLRRPENQHVLVHSLHAIDAY